MAIGNFSPATQALFPTNFKPGMIQNSDADDEQRKKKKKVMAAAEPAPYDAMSPATSLLYGRGGAL